MHILSAVRSPGTRISAAFLGQYFSSTPQSHTQCIRFETRTTPLPIQHLPGQIRGVRGNTSRFVRRAGSGMPVQLSQASMTASDHYVGVDASFLRPVFNYVVVSCCRGWNHRSQNCDEQQASAERDSDEWLPSWRSAYVWGLRRPKSRTLRNEKSRFPDGWTTAYG